MITILFGMIHPSKEDYLDLFQKISQGDMSSFLIIYKHQNQRIYSVAMHYCKLKHLAGDAVQQVFVELWEKKESLATVKDPEAWLWTVTKNQTLKILKRESTQKNYINYMKEFFSDEELTPIHQLISKQKSNLIERIINSLPLRQQEVYKLSRFEGLTYYQIGKQLGIGNDTVKEHLSKALKRIKQIVLQYESELKLTLLIYFF